MDFYLYILDQIKNNKSPYSLCSKHNISKQKLSYYIKQLKDKGIIRRVGYGVWQQVKEFVVGEEVEKPSTNLHALNIKFPILDGKVMDNDWEIKERLNNWLPKYTDLSILGGLKIKNNNNKSITVFAKTRNIKDIEEVDNLSYKIREYIYHFFKKQGVTLDKFNCETKNINLATADKQSESMLRKGEKFELDLNKKAEKIFQEDNIDGKAWIDGSPYKFTAETNDKAWKREYLSMPFRILDMFRLMEVQAKNISLFAKHLKSHTEMVIEMKKMAKKLNNKLDQRKLTEW